MDQRHELGAARVRVPASTSNLGAGFDCLGLAFNRYLTATFEPGGTGLRLERGRCPTPLAVPAGEDLLVQAFRARIARAGGLEPTGVIRVASEIPIARGLGSSAAAVVAGIGLAAGALSLGRLDRLDTLRDATTREGHPDNSAPAVFGGLVAVARGSAGYRPLSLPLSSRIGFAFAAPALPVRTADARRVLPPSLPFEEAVGGLGRLVALLEGLAKGDPELLAIGLADRLHVPHRLPLIPHASRALAAADEAGAWAATISGSGSGLIALCEPERAGAVAAAMADAFAVAGSGDGPIAFAASPDWHGVRIEEVSAAFALAGTGASDPPAPPAGAGPDSIEEVTDGSR